MKDKNPENQNLDPSKVRLCLRTFAFPKVLQKLCKNSVSINPAICSSTFTNIQLSLPSCTFYEAQKIIASKLRLKSLLQNTHFKLKMKKPFEFLFFMLKKPINNFLHLSFSAELSGFCNEL